MTGMFGYDDSLINTGAIDGTQIDFLMIEGFLNGGSIGTFAGTSTAEQRGDADPFNFNFNTTTQTFIVGGSAFGATGQSWNSGFLSNSSQPFFGYCQLKSNWADLLPRTNNLNAAQSMSYEFVHCLIFGQIHLT